MRKAKVPASSAPLRYKGLGKEKIAGTISRTWDDMPPDAVISTWVLVRFLKIHPRTLQRHRDRGVISSARAITKREAERWLRYLDSRGGVRPGRPRKHERQALLFPAGKKARR
jgi:hypothetical protein